MLKENGLMAPALTCTCSKQQTNYVLTGGIVVLCSTVNGINSSEWEGVYFHDPLQPQSNGHGLGPDTHTYIFMMGITRHFVFGTLLDCMK